MPHEAATHSNLGLSLALLGKFDLAEKELNKALELDKASPNARVILDAMHLAERDRIRLRPRRRPHCAP